MSLSLDTHIQRLPNDFLFGVATSSYQIEGSDFGNCGLSHWDEFAKQSGRVFNNDDGSIACDHYHLWESDLDLVRDAGFKAYRFSFSWPRLLPENAKTVNPDGIAFYDRLIDGMLERGIQPFATLYHWDLPARYAQKGGWQMRDTANYFADYTDLVMRHFGDRLFSIAPINEPWCVSWLSHYWGHHAPGVQSISAAARSMHYIQLAHGLSIQVMRSHNHNYLGCVLNKEYAVPFDYTEEAANSTHLFDGIYNRWFDESIFNGTYPEEVLTLFDGHMPDNYSNDMAIIMEPLDWVGTNYYTRSLIQPDKSEPNIGFKCVRGNLPKTDMGWEIAPEGLTHFIKRTTNYAPDLPHYITENGMAAADDIRQGNFQDLDRIDYFNSHLERIADLKAQGVHLAGYFAWSLLDNYEWAFGYAKRFGVVHVDFSTQKRTPKSSYLAWQNALANRP
ncbi:MAG: beta-glucosidase [Alphaproteobacteria bacterium]|nr:beta-glucosidase [Alphaproteobacteria bacterium]